jgi:hypothetical protein
MMTRLGPRPAACLRKAPKRPIGLSSAAVAQLVEQRIRNAWVGGSNPFRGTSKTRDCGHVAYDSYQTHGVTLLVGRDFKGFPGLIVEIPQITVPEGDEPNGRAPLLDAEGLAGRDD